MRTDSHTSMRDSFEMLETRRLLAADLDIGFDLDTSVIPAVVVPGDRFVPGGGKLEAPVTFFNDGPQAANGLVTIRFYLSTDAVLNTAADTLLRSYDNEPLFLPVFDDNPDNIGVFEPDMTIPATIAPGTYFLIVRVTANSQVDDTNTANNTDALSLTLNIQRRFGSFENRTGVVLSLNDPEGTLVTFSMTGNGAGTVGIDSAGRFIMNITGSTLSDATVSTSGGDNRIDFASITVSSIRTLTATTSRLVGPFTIASSLGSLIIGDVLNAGTITIPATSAAPRFTFGAVQNLSIFSETASIQSISASSWADSNMLAQPDIITAPSLGSLSIASNFRASLSLLGETVTGPHLGAVSIGGVVKGGTWNVNGRGTSVTVGATVVGWSASFALRLDSLNVTNTLRGVVTARSFGTITVGKDVLQAQILAGAYLGSDGKLGGAPDSYATGNIGTIVINGRVGGSNIFAGVEPIPTAAAQPSYRILGGTAARITSISVAGPVAANSKFLANRYAGSVLFSGNQVSTATDTRFQMLTIAPSVDIIDVTNNPATGTGGGGMMSTQFVTIHINSTNLIDLSSITIDSFRYTGTGMISLTNRAFLAGSKQAGAMVMIRVDVFNPTPSVLSHDLTLKENVVKDIRGNFIVDEVPLGSWVA